MTLSVQALVGKAEAALRRESEAKALRLEVKATEANARRLEDEAQTLRAEVLAALVAEGETGFTTDTFVIERVPTPPKVELDGEVDEKTLTWKGAPLPARWIVTSPRLNRTLLSATMKGGEAVPFARLVVGETLKIERLSLGDGPQEEF